MRTKPSAFGRVHFRPAPRGYFAVHALRLAHRAVDREDGGGDPRSLRAVESHARSHMRHACA